MTHHNTSVFKATAVGATAVLMWSTLALFTVSTGDVPPFQLLAMSFTIAFFIGLTLWLKKGDGILTHLRLPGRVWLLGIFGLFGYHFFYFLALKTAPPVEANLINYLWPLLIVLFSALLPGEQLRWFHIVGAAAGFIGAGLLVTKGQGISFDTQYGLGYLAAVTCAFIWAIYSVLSRYFGAVPTNAVGGFCGATAILALFCHLLFEQTVWPQGSQWLAILLLGLGPVGAAFFVWDYGLKRGNIKALGAFSYAAPLLSTNLLVVFQLAEPSWQIAVACIFIMGGAVLAAGDFFTTRPQSSKVAETQ